MPAPQTDFAPWDDPGATPLIRFDGVTKRFGETTAVDRIDLSIYPREFFALLGPSGCGKTTLMRMLAGFEDVTEGAITIDGADMAGVAPNARPVNMMFQSYALFPHLSVADNIAFGLKRSAMAKADIPGRVEEMVKLVQLQGFEKRKPHQISGGQAQRVALARALAKGPKLLLLDEPLGALDKKLRQETQFELMDIQERTGTTFVIVTHDQEEAMTVASRVAVMETGRLKQVDTPERIYEAPNSTYVADFIGDVSLIAGVAGPEGLAWAEGQPPLQGAGDVAGPATLAVRPEKVAIHKEAPQADNVIPGKVVDIAYLGNISTYHVEIAGGAVIKAQTANAERFQGRGFTWDEDVFVSFARDSAVVLAS